MRGAPYARSDPALTYSRKPVRLDRPKCLITFPEPLSDASWDVVSFMLRCASLKAIFRSSSTNATPAGRRSRAWGSLAHPESSVGESASTDFVDLASGDEDSVSQLLSSPPTAVDDTEPSSSASSKGKQRASPKGKQSANSKGKKRELDSPTPVTPSKRCRRKIAT